MASIIKSTERGSALSASAFNFDDMSSKADTYVQQIRAQAAKILAEANQQADRIRKQAELDGLQAARKQMQAEVEAETGRRMTTVLPALQAVVGELQDSQQAWIAHWEATGVRLACRIAERILHRELMQDPTLPATFVREALELAVADDGVRVLLNPLDVERIGPQIERLVAELKPTGKVEITADERIGVGGCKLETRFGSIDHQIAAQLRRIEEELI